eukprot:CAMPEP_0114244156 /NCGR_PEP_ID=MMETSP0058-20121206/11185_1 /TAXON_ID=36894 /ORGANISM="Pyramimonas parkeae, CCMP726" /LENGTH=127 /DNA_ID=CAMNT_0001357069 /DNA_START=458 /DNA_END=842 /DNA_ORIENTATION=-
MSPHARGVVHHNQAEAWDTGNMEELSPCCMATAVVSPMHSAECEEGMPPASTIACSLHFPVLKKWVGTFNVCANSQAQYAVMKVWLCRHAATAPRIPSVAPPGITAIAANIPRGLPDRFISPPARSR